MKMKFIGLSLLLAFATVSCVKNDIDSNDNHSKITISITAGEPEVNTTDPDLKTALDGSQALWVDGDKLAVFQTAGGVVTAVESEAGVTYDEGATMSFAASFDASEATAFEYNAVYPYATVIKKSEYGLAALQLDLPSVQYPTASSFGNGADLLLAKPVSSESQPSELSFAFTRPIAIGKMKIKGFESTSEVIKRVTLTAAEGVALTGECYANLADGTISAGSNALNYVKVEYAEPLASDGIVYFSTIPTAFVAGNKLTIKVETDVKIYEKELTVGASGLEFNVNRLANFTANLKDATVSHKILLEWVYGGPESNLAGTCFRSTVPAIDNEGNVYFSQGVHENEVEGGIVRKLNNKGELQASYNMELETAGWANPSIEMDGSVVYIAGGLDGCGKCVALNASDLTPKWAFEKDKFFGGNATPAPTIHDQTAPAIGNECIFIGNAKTVGTVISINKDTGERVAYVSGNNAGTGGPAGGVVSGLSLTRSGMVSWACIYGLYTADAAEMENPTEINGTYGAFVPYNTRYITRNWKYQNSGVACLTLDGVDHVAFAGSYSNSIYALCAKAQSATTLTNLYDPLNAYVLSGCADQDQGGIVIGPRQELIFSVKHNSTHPGGVYASNPRTGELMWKFEIGKPVDGAVAVDNNGYIHIPPTTNDGEYFIIEPDYVNKTAVVKASCKLHEIIADAGYSWAESIADSRAWTSVMIDQSGKIYMAAEMYDAEHTPHAAVVCMSYAPTEGPGKTGWPMRYADSYHSNRQGDDLNNYSNEGFGSPDSWTDVSSL